jgi:DnaJ-class molecular chaperone
MAKKKGKPISGGLLIETAPEKIGTRTLLVCPTCGGFGAVMYETGDWKSCLACQGGGRVWESKEVVQ